MTSKAIQTCLLGLALLSLFPIVLCSGADRLQRHGSSTDPSHHQELGQAGRLQAWPQWPEWPPDMAGLVVSKGYPFEAHWVTTDDGYRLQIFRLPTYRPGRRAAQPALLMHGLLVRKP